MRVVAAGLAQEAGLAVELRSRSVGSWLGHDSVGMASMAVSLAQIAVVVEREFLQVEGTEGIAAPTVKMAAYEAGNQAVLIRMALVTGRSQILEVALRMAGRTVVGMRREEDFRARDIVMAVGQTLEDQIAVAVGISISMLASVRSDDTHIWYGTMRVDPRALGTGRTCTSSNRSRISTAGRSCFARCFLGLESRQSRLQIIRRFYLGLLWLSARTTPARSRITSRRSAIRLSLVELLQDSLVMLLDDVFRDTLHAEDFDVKI